MTAFLTSVSDFFSAVGGLLLNFVKNIVYILTVIPKATKYLEVIYAYLPVAILPFATCAIGICIVYLLVDR